MVHVQLPVAALEIATARARRRRWQLGWRYPRHGQHSATIGAALAPAVEARKFEVMEARVLALLALSMVLGGCGVAETGATAAAGAESAAQQAAQGRAAEDKVRQQIDAAYKQAADQRRAAETDGQ
jgi:hypothetical protein